MNLTIDEEKKGKNYSRNNTGKRKQSDFYETPYSMTEQLLNAEIFSKTVPIHEPACGNGAICKVLDDRRFKYSFSDAFFPPKVDFLQDTKQYPVIITNPPFSIALEFIMKAKQICTWKFALLLPTDYLHGQERWEKIFSDDYFPLAKIFTFTRKPMLGDPLRADGKYNTGMQGYSWFLFNREYRERYPQIHWISNQQYVLTAHDAIKDRKSDE